MFGETRGRGKKDEKETREKESRKMKKRSISNIKDDKAFFSLLQSGPVGAWNMDSSTMKQDAAFVALLIWVLFLTLKALIW